PTVAFSQRGLIVRQEAAIGSQPQSSLRLEHSPQPIGLVHNRTRRPIFSDPSVRQLPATLRRSWPLQSRHLLLRPSEPQSTGRVRAVKPMVHDTYWRWCATELAIGGSSPAPW